MPQPGYRPGTEAVYRLWNLTLSLTLTALLLWLFAAIAAALLVTQGPDIFYRGPRLGRHRRTFHILKFRTLRPEAAALTREQVLPRGSNLETPLGKFLRASRLDELPQLFNVIKGDMNLVGPRPVRRELAEKWGARLDGYDVRFQVKPGLIGYTQCLMSHGTSKRIRHRLNRRLCRRPVSLAAEVLFLARVGLTVLGKAAALLARTVVRTPPEPEVIAAAALFEGDRVVARAHVVEITPTDLVLATPGPWLPPGECRVRLTGPGANRRGKTATCLGHLQATDIRSPLLSPDGVELHYFHTVSYRPASDFHHYLIDRYFLKDAIIL